MVTTNTRAMVITKKSRAFLSHPLGYEQKEEEDIQAKINKIEKNHKEEANK
jgi:hypothetical protein